jgi:hypothetical protein
MRHAEFAFGKRNNVVILVVSRFEIFVYKCQRSQKHSIVGRQCAQKILGIRARPLYWANFRLVTKAAFKSRLLRNKCRRSFEFLAIFVASLHK